MLLPDYYNILFNFNSTKKMEIQFIAILTLVVLSLSFTIEKTELNVDPRKGDK